MYFMEKKIKEQNKKTKDKSMSFSFGEHAFSVPVAAPPTFAVPVAAPPTVSLLPEPLDEVPQKASAGRFTLGASTSSAEDTEKTEVVRVFKFPADSPKLESAWRKVQWTDEQRTALMDRIRSYKPSSEEVTRARVLLLGPVGSGKSSFISSVQSVFDGRVTNRAMLQSFSIRGQKGEGLSGLALYDIMGLGDGDMTGLTLNDILAIIKGHAPDGHKFSPAHPLSSDVVGYVKRPSLKDKIHCVAFVVDASKILTYPKGLSATFQQLREHISDLGVHQVALLTHIDQICSETAKDVTHVYKSKVIRDVMSKAGALLGMSTSYIVPVKNYSSELDLDVNTDLLLLSAVDHILQYSDLYFLDNVEQTQMKL